MLETIISIVGIIVTAVSIVVTVISIVQNDKDNHQKSNRPEPKE